MDITMLYTYKISKIHSVYDGDTVTVDIDLGLNVVIRKEKVRLYGIDTPELRGVAPEIKAKGIVARDWLHDQLDGADEVLVRTHKDKSGKYGRLLGELFADGVNLNETLVELGMAVEI
tara:strand:- start:400 stop:753 length:354 start_codon:yes stop_codon:yes gene_type:complete